MIKFIKVFLDYDNRLSIILLMLCYFFVPERNMLKQLLIILNLNLFLLFDHQALFHVESVYIFSGCFGLNLYRIAKNYNRAHL